MKERDRIGKSELPDFLRYARGEMTDRERNAFERELQKDPFVEEAAEGFSGISPDTVNEDISRLRRQLKTRVTRRHRFFYFRIAASIAVLMIISSVFVIVQRKDQSKEPGEVITNPVSLDIPESKAITEPIIPEIKDEITNQGKQAAVKSESAGKSEPVEQSTTDKRARMAENKTEPVALPVKDAVELLVAEENAAAPVAAVSRQQPDAFAARGIIISSEDSMPIAGVNVMLKGKNTSVMTDTEGYFKINLPEEKGRTLVANFIGMKTKEFEARDDKEMRIQMEPDAAVLSEVVVVGYGAAKSTRTTAAAANKADYKETGYNPPLPANGNNSFDKYIEENIKVPVALTAGERAVVVISFIVKSTGTIDSIRVLRSPGNEFSDEAKRLVMEGPSWKPAVSNGEKIDDEVRVRIVFK